MSETIVGREEIEESDELAGWRAKSFWRRKGGLRREFVREAGAAAWDMDRLQIQIQVRVQGFVWTPKWVSRHP